jgi:hypothetical protein
MNEIKRSFYSLNIIYMIFLRGKLLRDELRLCDDYPTFIFKKNLLIRYGIDNSDICNKALTNKS